MFQLTNATVTEVSNYGYYIPIENYFAIGVIAIISIALMGLFIYGCLVLGKRLDRYRLKYGFDNELELKDMNEKNPKKKEFRLTKRHEAFNRRVFKD